MERIKLFLVPLFYGFYLKEMIVNKEKFFIEVLQLKMKIGNDRIIILQLKDCREKYQ